jgi:hypothetical protein
MNQTIQSLTQTTTHLISENNTTIRRGQALIAAGDPLVFQTIDATNDLKSEPNEYEQLGEMGEALREAEQRGFTYNPYDLEDITYGADDIRKFAEGDFSALDNAPGTYGLG